MPINAYSKKKEGYQINNLTLTLKELEKEEQPKPKVNRRKEIIMIRTEIRETKKKKKPNKQKIDKTKSWVFENISQIYKSLETKEKKKRRLNS